MTEVDPDPREPAEGQGTSQLGAAEVPADGDPTGGGKRGQIGDAPSVAEDEPDDGSGYPAGGSGSGA